MQRSTRRHAGLRWLVWAAVALAGAACPAWADRVVLKSGSTFTGTVIEQNEAHVVLRTEFGEISFNRKEVASVTLDAKTQAGARPAPTGSAGGRNPGGKETGPGGKKTGPDAGTADGSGAATPAAPTETPAEDGAGDGPAFRIVAHEPAVSPETAHKNWDILSQADWGLAIQGFGPEHVFNIEKGGSTVVTAPAATKLRAALIDVDPVGYDRCTDWIPFVLEPGATALVFPEGSRVPIEIEPFDAEAASGADARPEGAGTITPGQPVIDHVSFVDQDRTDHWRLDVAQASTMEGLVATAGAPPQLAWWQGDGAQVTAQGGVALFQGRLSAGGHVLRVRARPDQGQVHYRMLFVAVEPAGEGRDALVRFALDLAGEGLANAGGRIGLPRKPGGKRNPGKAPAAGPGGGTGGTDSGPATGAEIAATGPGSDWLPILRKLAGASARAEIVRGLAHPSTGARALAATAAGELGLTEARERLETLAQDDRSAEVRQAAATASEKLRQAK